MLLQQTPILVEVASQPPVTPGISYGSLLGSAGLMAVAILCAAALVGLVVGGGIIWLKHRKGAAARGAAPTHVRLEL